MTDFDRTDDELVSAYLDDEVTTEEAALVEARPELLARVDEFRAVQGALGAPPTSPPRGAQLDDMIGAALEGFGNERKAEVLDFPTDRVTEPAKPKAATTAAVATGTAQSTRSSGVADLQAARERKHRRSRWLLSAAAAVVLAVAIPAALNNISGGEDSSTASSSSDFALETASSADAESSDDAMEESATDSGRVAGDESNAGSDAAGAAMATQAMSDDAAMEEDEAASDDDAMSEDDAADSADSADAKTATAATVPATATLEEDETQSADGVAGTSSPGLFLITSDVADLVSTLEKPGVIEELEAMGAEFDAPTLECAAEGEAGGLARLLSTDMIAEIILSSTDQTSPIRIVEQETCSVLTTIER